MRQPATTISFFFLRITTISSEPSATDAVSRKRGLLAHAPKAVMFPNQERRPGEQNRIGKPKDYWRRSADALTMLLISTTSLVKKPDGRDKTTNLRACMLRLRACAQKTSRSRLLPFPAARLRTKSTALAREKHDACAGEARLDPAQLVREVKKATHQHPHPRPPPSPRAEKTVNPQTRSYRPSEIRTKSRSKERD